jgi:hypothetical protein
MYLFLLLQRLTNDTQRLTNDTQRLTNDTQRFFVLAGKFHVSIIDSALRLETNATNDKRQTVDTHLDKL